MNNRNSAIGQSAGDVFVGRMSCLLQTLQHHQNADLKSINLSGITGAHTQVRPYDYPDGNWVHCIIA